MDKLLVIDDEPGIRKSIAEVFQSDELAVLLASNAEEGLTLLREDQPLVVLLDIRLGRESGWEVFERLKAIDPKVIVIFITGHGSTDTAIESMKLGAFEYLVKPFDIDQLLQVVEQALKIGRLMRLPAMVDTSEQQNMEGDRLIGNGAAMQSICKQIGRIAPQDVNVLILGESGTGKELVARAIYQHSKRNTAPFLAINCAAIPEMLLESELFGHEKGAFTGADRQRIGKFEQCHLGTIFLDEVGDMPVSTQAKILRLMQDGQFQRVGGNDTRTVDVRVIAATHQNLEKMIEAGNFRGDLFYRLRGVTLHLPALRDRSEDLAELAHYFLFRYNRQLGTSVQTITNETLEALSEYRWPGNIRELQSVIREALIVSTGTTLLPEFLPLETRMQPDSVSQPSIVVAEVERSAWNELGSYVETSFSNKEPNAYRNALEKFDRLIVSKAMNITNGHQSMTCELLGISQPTLRSKLRTIFASQSGNSEEP